MSGRFGGVDGRWWVPSGGVDGGGGGSFVVVRTFSVNEPSAGSPLREGGCDHAGSVRCAHAAL